MVIKAFECKILRKNWYTCEQSKESCVTTSVTKKNDATYGRLMKNVDKGLNLSLVNL